MAKVYEQFKREFTELKQKSDQINAQFSSFEKSQKNLFGYVEEGAKELGLRVQELKHNGHAGKTLGDFLFDAEVKKMVVAINTSTTRLEDDVKQLNSYKANGGVLVKNWKALSTELENEIKSRKKQVTTKVGIGNKSLPDMEKLLVEVKKALGDHGAADDLESNLKLVDEPGHWTKEKNKVINEELIKTRDLALSGLQQDLMKQMLDIRNLNINVGKAKKLYESVLDGCKQMEAAIKARDSKKMAAAKNLPTVPLKELVTLAVKFETALKDPVIARMLKNSKDASAVQSGVKTITDLRLKAMEAIKKMSSGAKGAGA